MWGKSIYLVFRDRLKSKYLYRCGWVKGGSMGVRYIKIFKVVEVREERVDLGVVV